MDGLEGTIILVGSFLVQFLIWAIFEDRPFFFIFHFAVYFLLAV